MSPPSLSRLLAPAVFAALLFAARAPAQELSVLGGYLPETPGERSSYVWEVDYRQDLLRDFAASMSYINEGHLRAHHRDGTAWEGWARLPLFHDHVALAVGAGGYYFFDTQPRPGGDTADVHGLAAIYSLSATAYLSDRWFLRANFNRIAPSHQLNTDTLTAGVGFWFGRDKKPTPGRLGDAPDEHEHLTENELTVFGGQTVVNTFLSPRARAYAVEYRRGWAPHLDWTLSGIYEGDPEIIRRSGGATQVWVVNTFFHDRVSVGAGLGPYVYLDRKNPRGPGRRNPAAVAPLVSLTAALRLSDNWTLRAVFDRVTTDYNRDSDVFLLGVGWRWPR